MDIYSKFDLHIHSYASSQTKSGDKTVVADSRIENIHILIDKLVKNNVNVVAIADHNIFDEKIYVELKKQESIDNCIHKVLPGIEFDLEIESKNVHVVCIFDDTDPEHIYKISNGFEQKDCYSIDDLGSVLRKIGLGVVLIAHQKCDYKAESQQKTSLSSIGQDIFYKFIACEFFDSLEVQSSKVEGILKFRFDEDEIDNFHFVTGSDCHEWSAYPAHHAGRPPAELLYMKALPTFQGLVMAITDYSRIYKTPEPPKKNTLPNLEINCNGESLLIDLSNKINVIIGDNSVGKSTLIKCLCGQAEKNAIEFLKSHQVEIITPQIDRSLFLFSGQGKIREMFESTEEKLPIRQRFKESFKLIDKYPYINKIKDIFNGYLRVWERNEKIIENMHNINKLIHIPLFTAQEKHYLSVEGNVKILNNEYQELSSVFDEIVLSFKKFNKYQSIIEDDLENLVKIYSEILSFKKKYKLIEKDIDNKNEIINIFNYVTTTYNESIVNKSSSDELFYTTYIQQCNKAINSICTDIEYKFAEKEDLWSSFNEFKIEASINSHGKYCFIDKPIFEDLINKDLIIKFISRYINIEKPLEDLSTSEILTSIRGKRINDKSSDNIQEFVETLFELFITTYFNTTVEIKRGNDKLNESNSAGINALYYLDILSYTFNKSIFIIDQPEDDVSQSRISTDLIPSLKNLSKTAQVILITHNPQLVVNLDADNVIILKKDDTQIKFYSGALEYRNNQFSILELVAGTLDGGTEVIKKRWKRYAKTSV